MHLLVATTIDGQERKKKLTAPEGATIDTLRPLVAEAFAGEKSLGELQRLEVHDEAFGEYVDLDAAAVVQDKARLRAVFRTAGGGAAAAASSATEAEKDRVIEQLRSRLVHLEGNLRMLSSKAMHAADRSETHSQKSATSDLRRRKCEEKHMRSEPQPDDELRKMKREEKKNQRKQEAAAEMML